MIHSLEIENFKAFGRREKIPFAPITLIFGENSAGKSSILHALNILKQTRESREAGALLLPRTEKGIVDLGSFQDLLYKHDLSKNLTFKLECSTRNKPPFLRNFPFERMALEFSFSRPTLHEEVTLTHLKVFLADHQECLASFQPTPVSKEFFRNIFLFGARDRRLIRSRLRAVRCDWFSERTDYWEPAFNEHKTKRSEILGRMKARWNIIQEQQALEEHSAQTEGTDIELDEERTTLNQRYREAIQFYSDAFTLESFVKRRKEDALGKVLAIDGFMPIPTGTTRINPSRLPEDEFLKRGDIGSLNLNDITIFAGRALENVLESLFPLGPFRRPPERWYIFTGTRPQDVGYQGDLLPDLLFRSPELVESTNDWLKKLGIGYSIKLCSVGEQTKDLFEVRLVDTRKKDTVEVSLSDVGFGISQLLPFIVQSLATEEQILSIEQPEVHIHPKLQADLGDLLMEAIKPPRNNQFIIETHSEHLILRILRRIRESANSKEDSRLRPEDVCVLYVSQENTGAKVVEIPILPEGEFAKNWPKGFFEERANELF